uniref:Uncharacterized protein n=1 Tax=Cercocebus atys TaxID=9531 RepID=A0A2K5L145_CERAT
MKEARSKPWPGRSSASRALPSESTLLSRVASGIPSPAHRAQFPSRRMPHTSRLLPVAMAAETRVLSLLNAAEGLKVSTQPRAEEHKVSPTSNRLHSVPRPRALLREGRMAPPSRATARPVSVLCTYCHLQSYNSPRRWARSLSPLYR